MKRNSIILNGKKIFYYESKDSGNAVVFVHGASSCSSIYIRQLIDSVLSNQFQEKWS